MILWWAEYASCAYLTGLILIIHFVHYPIFNLIKTSEFKNFAIRHGNRITPIVFPAMAAELGFAIALLGSERSVRSSANFASVLLLWAITGLKSAQTHSTLIKVGFSLSLHEELMRWNLARTVIWCLRFLGISSIVFLHSQ